MNGVLFKVVAGVFVLALTAISPSLIYASDVSSGSHKPKTLNSKAGCMMCHQGHATHPDKSSKKNHDNVHRQH